MYLPEPHFPLKSRLQEAGLIERAKKRGVHRKRRECAPWPGMMIHQDGSTHEWVAGRKWDLIAAMDGATSGQYSLFFIEEGRRRGHSHFSRLPKTCLQAKVSGFMKAVPQFSGEGI